MTIPATIRKAGPYSGTGAQTAWPFTFRVFAASDIAVTIADSLGVETLLTLGSQYSVSVNANQETSPGGTVTYPISGSPLPVGSRLVIVGGVPYDQVYDIPAGGNFAPTSLENQLDRAVMQIQQLRENLARALQVSVTTGANVGLPAPSANQLIGWDSGGSNLSNYALGELATGIGYGLMYFDTFTGDGTETAFSLSQDPVSLANLHVAVSGVTQVPGVDYSLITGDLVFTSAPGNGTTILAQYGQALVIGEIGDGTVSVPKLAAGFILPQASGGTGAGSLAGAGIAQLGVAQTFTATQVADNGTGAVSATGTYTFDGADQIRTVTLTNAITVTFGAPTGITPNAFYVFRLAAGDTSARTFAWNSAYKFPGGSSPLTSGTVINGASDIITFIGGASNTLLYVGHQADVR